MENFIKIIKHRKRLKSALKTLSINEFEKLVKDIQELYEQRLEEIAELEKEREAKQEKIDEIKSILTKEGISLEDLTQEEALPNPKKPTRSVEPKYRVIDSDGQEHLWTGRGRAPKAFQAYFDQGHSKENCLISA